MKYKKPSIFAASVVFALGFCLKSLLAQENIEINRPAQFLGLTPPTPIAITGFSGEVANVLKFDLTVMGFTNIPPDSAHYLLQGKNNGNVEGQLSFGKS